MSVKVMMMDESAWTKEVVRFLMQHIPMLDQTGDWHHASITAYQISCQALAALGHAEETEWGARPIADPRLPDLLPRWDDICAAVLKLARQQHLISYRARDGGLGLRRVNLPTHVKPTALPPPNISTGDCLGLAHAAGEVLPVLTALGLINGGFWTIAAELILWREQPEAWQMDVTKDSRFTGAVKMASTIIPEDIHAELDRLATITDADVAQLMALQKSFHAQRQAEAQTEAVCIPPLTSEVALNGLTNIWLICN